MMIREIVAAFVDNARITTNPAAISAARTFGRDIQLISRAQAKDLALLERSQEWLDLAIARTLFLSDGAALFAVTSSFETRNSAS
jgi:hypothetical protein